MEGLCSSCHSSGLSGEEAQATSPSLVFFCGCLCFLRKPSLVHRVSLALAAAGDNLVQEAAAFTLQHRLWCEAPGIFLTFIPPVAGVKRIP